MPTSLLNDPATLPIDSVQELGIELRPTESGGRRHIALVCKVDEKAPAMLCHLAWHHALRTEPASGKYPWAQSALGSSTRRVIAGFCLSVASRISQGNPKINFGFDVYLQCFDKSGRYLPVSDGQGLTCATFVLEIFKKRGIDLLKAAEWPSDRAEDLAWKAEVIKDLRTTQAHYLQKGDHQAVEGMENHITALEASPDSPRYRPEEVAAGAQHIPTPMPYAKAEMAGKEILSELFERYQP